jgi:hypothetical protein
MNLSLPEKMDRTIAFLLAARHVPIASALALHGYRQEDHEEGWSLIRAIGYADVAGAPLKSSSLKQLLEQRTALAKAEAELWAWYLEWSAVANLAIKQPALREQLGLPTPHLAIARPTATGAHDDPGSAPVNWMDPQHP